MAVRRAPIGGAAPFSKVGAQLAALHSPTPVLSWLATHDPDARDFAVLLPTQDQIPELSPVQRLWLMTFVDALRCAARRTIGHESATAWLLSREDQPYTCVWVCEHLNWDVRWVRDRVRRVLAAGMRKGLSVRGGRYAGHRQVA